MIEIAVRLAMLALQMHYGAFPVQGNCYCAHRVDLSESFSCDTTWLENGGQLFYRFNCDSLWLTYLLPTGEQHPLFSDTAISDPFLRMYGVRYQFVREYPRHLLFRERI